MSDSNRDLLPTKSRARTCRQAAGAVLTALIAVAWVPRATAQDSARPANDGWDKPLTLALDLGLATPTGFVGAEAQYDPVRYLGVAGGVGVNRVGPQLMAAVRPRLPLGERVALSLSLGWSMGPHKPVEAPLIYIDGDPPVFDRHWSPAHWLNADAGLELMSAATSVRVYLGVARLLNVDDFTCTGDDIDVCETGVSSEESGAYSPWESYPFIGVQLGVMP